MFSTKRDIENWCNDFLKKNDAGAYTCPFTGDTLKNVRSKGGWSIESRGEEWVWRVEDLKAQS